MTMLKPPLLLKLLVVLLAPWRNQALLPHSRLRGAKFRARSAPSAPRLRTAMAAAGQGPEVICVGDALYDCIALDSARGWPAEKVIEEGAW